MDRPDRPRLYRACLLKEGLWYVFKVKGDEGKKALDRWLSSASCSRIDAFVRLGREIRRHRAGIDAALEHGLSSAPLGSASTKIRLITRIAFGFRDPAALIALASFPSVATGPRSPGRR